MSWLDILDPSKSIKPLQDSLILLKQYINSSSLFTIAFLILVLHFIFRPASSRGNDKGGLFYRELIEVAVLKKRPIILEWYRVSYVIVLLCLILLLLVSLVPWHHALPFLGQALHVLGQGVVLMGLVLIICIFRYRLFDWINRQITRLVRRRQQLVAAFGFLALVVLLAFLTNRDPGKSFSGKLSSGDDILIDNGSDIKSKNDAWLQDPQSKNPWKQVCLDHWALKKDKNFSRFVEKCPNDSEARIYLSNKEASELAKRTPGSMIANVALAVPISRDNGNGVFQSIEIMRGVSLAQQEINRSSSFDIGGKKGWLRVHILDDGNYAPGEEQQEARRVATFLVNRAQQINLLAIIGHASSDATEAVSRIYQNSGLVAISPSSTAPRARRIWHSFLQGSNMSTTNRLDLGPNIFRVSPNDERAVQTIQDYIRNFNMKNQDKQIRTVAIVYESGNRYGELYKKLFENSMDKIAIRIANKQGPVNDVCRIDPSGDIENCKQLIRASSANAVYLVPSAKSAVYFRNFVKIKSEKWGEGVRLFGADSMYNDIWFNHDIAPYTVGMVVAAPNRNVNRRRESWRTAMAYDATHALAQAIQNASNSRLCLSNLSHHDAFLKCLRDDLNQQLLHKDFVSKGGLGDGTVQFDSLGDRVVEVDQNNATPEYADRLSALYCIRPMNHRLDFKELGAGEICP